MAVWEHKILRVNGLLDILNPEYGINEHLEVALNQYGKDGWELVTITNVPYEDKKEHKRIFLKRKTLF